MIIAVQKTVLNTWKLAAAFILFSLNALHGHRLFPDDDDLEQLNPDGPQVIVV
jgi:hypothetical protein